MNINIREYMTADAAAASEIWNQVVDDGVAFPQEEVLTPESGDAFFGEQTYGVLQFNAVVASNVHALHLYKRIGFTPLGVIPGGFRMPDGHYEDIIPHYYDLRKDADQ